MQWGRHIGLSSNKMFCMGGSVFREMLLNMKAKSVINFVAICKIGPLRVMSACAYIHACISTYNVYHNVQIRAWYIGLILTANNRGTSLMIFQ